MNFIMCYDWQTEKEEKVFTIPDTDPNNIFLFSYLSDGRLFIADMNCLYQVDANTGRELCTLSKVGDGADWPFYQKIHVCQGEEFAFTLSTTKLNKINIKDKNSLSLACTGVANNFDGVNGTLWSMQVVENLKRVYLSKEYSGKNVKSSTEIFEFSMTDLKKLRTIAPQADFGRSASFLYSQANA